MKKLLLIALISFVGIKASNAQIGMLQAKSFINITNEFIMKSQHQLQIHHVYNGDFSHAVRHQRYAIKLFKERQYGKAFFHSVSARYYANLCINANAGEHKMFIETLSDVEKELIINNPTIGYWQPSRTGQETQHLNQTFVNVAVHQTRRQELDHIAPFVNIDKDLENGDLQIENLQTQY
ncbi:MAG: hypothetical protein JXR53_13115 [Bacteroidales bacterium]|nr:hypothetical protein [Bacteroidales bacterium]